MRDFILLVSFLFLFNSSLSGQGDSIPQVKVVENIFTATPKAKELTIDMSNPEEVELALKRIHTFRYLESIILDGEPNENSLKKLFYRLSVLRNLSRITLKENELTKIPENISNIKTLQSLTIEGNVNLDYTDLCVRLKTTSVSELNLIDNDLKKTPGNLSEISSLRKIQLSGSNQLNYTELVEQLAKLPALTTLSIPVNYISELPPNIDKLKTLQLLDVSNNNLVELPEEISGLKAINNLSIQGNLLFNPAKDLEKIKGNNIQYLSLDKELSGEELEQIKKMFPGAQIDFPLSNDPEEDEAKKQEQETFSEIKPVRNGELKAKKETRILSGAYAFYAGFFQSLIYTFDTLTFEERYRDLRYSNGYQILNNGVLRLSLFYFNNKKFRYQTSGKRHEIWFRMSLEDRNVWGSYPELRAFSGMYWVYEGELSKKQFKRKYLRKKGSRGYRVWSDVRIELNKNNSLFTIRVKSDTAFSEFTAYPKFPHLPLEKSRQTYNKRLLVYKKALLRRNQNFNKLLSRNKASYDRSYRRMQDYSWKELQLRMSDEEKRMSKEEWLNYYDDLIANEQKAIDNSALLFPYILRSLFLKGYAVPGQSDFILQRTAVPPANPKSFGIRTWSIDFVDSKSLGKLPVSTVLILDNKTKTVSQVSGTIGLFPTLISLQQFSSYTLLVELRNGNWGLVSSEEIDRQTFEPAKTFQLKALVFDKNLDTIGDLLKNGVK